MLSEGNNYILGNLNPIMDKNLVENSSYWKDLFVICSILKNSHRLDVMNIQNKKNNMLTKKFLINDFRKRSRKGTGNLPNHYKMFLDYIDTGKDDEKNNIYSIVEGYFRNILNSFIQSLSY